MRKTPLDHLPETIVAVATPPGEGAIGIVRLSGPAALPLAGRLFRCKGRKGNLAPYRLTLGTFRDPADGQIIDEVMAVSMPGPRSYTGEDVVEFHAHGGEVVLARIVDTAVAGGARPAAPGEFTRRAFLNGRLDLTQAEAVIDLIRSRSAAAQKAALKQLDGGLSRPLRALQDALRAAAAEVEAAIEFSEEEELGIALPVESLSAATEKVAELLKGEGITQGRERGREVVLTGRTNVGKSSIINALDNSSRVIVTSRPGTTRDTIEIPLFLEGIFLLLTDTAGIGTPRDEADEEGIRRSMKKLSGADLPVVVLDSSEPLVQDDYRLLSETEGRSSVVVCNKMDLDRRADLEKVRLLAGNRRVVEMSAKTGEGLGDLRRALAACARELSPPPRGVHSIAVNARHADALHRSLAALERAAAAAVRSGPLDMLATDLREALSALGEITGETVTEEILDHIFSTFCIGK
jgi:tRNA modification GTPase